MLVTLLLNSLVLIPSRRPYSGNWHWAILSVVCIRSFLKSGSLYWLLFQIEEAFLAVTSKVSGSSWSAMGFTIWVSDKTFLDLSVIWWKKLLEDWKSLELTYLFTATGVELEFITYVGCIRSCS